MTVAPSPTLHIWTREEYYRMADMGLFEGKRVELINGQVVDMSPMLSPHAVSVTLAARVFETVFAPGAHVRVQMPFVAANNSEPEPDLTVVVGEPRDYLPDHPSKALLLVEVAETSLEYDREPKSSLYARSGVPEYWIINLVDDQIEVFRQPVADETQPFGFGYQQLMTVDRSGTLSILARPAARIAAADLLP